ncbi:cold shock domain-containing protein [Streptomyces sp. 15-116A]|uniref:cold-shock protein n=1 Tax=Streptomyces sp. 15-116A TaxID=2259035 RepID=UPI0021B2CF51|nr:cold shock domain-containing protein [Streptomyces sp. 15-116A]MCT7351355.1 cold shock domain-containing protein [Streptomyces sp. 15-116A]
MPEVAPEDVFTGRVLEWHSEEGWGVLGCDALTDEVWAHYSVIHAEGFRELAGGQSVAFSAEQAEQDGYRWRAVCIWPEAGASS